MLNIDLFENIQNDKVLELLKCLGLKTKVYKKNSIIIKTNEKIDYLGIILSGSAQIYRTDAAGRRILTEKLKVDDIFAHDIVCLGIKRSPVLVETKEGCEVLFLPFEKVVTPCEKLCGYHIQLIKNILKIISKRNTLLNDKLDIVGQKTIRDKILALLNTYRGEERIFSIPFSREEMARFLCSDRSALSRELSKMRNEGILKYNKNHFEILK